jgi:uncharacterized protein YraI
MDLYFLLEKRMMFAKRRSAAMNKKSITSLTVVLVLILSACSLPGGGTNTDQPEDPHAMETFIANGIAQTQTAMASLLPAITLTASETPSPTLSPTPAVPTVSVTIETNCRSGPGTVYEIIGVLQPGETAEVMGRSSDGGTWIIRNPDGAGSCWLWGQYATVTGNWQILPVFDPPPTPTPTAGFSLAYLSTPFCMSDYAFRFQLVNTGSVTWQSYRVVVTDSTTASTYNYTEDKFTEYTGCGAHVNQLLDLEPGEGGVAGNWGSATLPYNPAGHTMSATFTLCSLDGLAGQCVDKTISFIP